MRLAGKAIVITGATGIAAASVSRASEEGARVFVVSRGETECRQLASEVDLAGYAVADLTDERQAIDAFAKAGDALGLAVAKWLQQGFHLPLSVATKVT